MPGGKLKPPPPEALEPMIRSALFGLFGWSPADKERLKDVPRTMAKRVSKVANWDEDSIVRALREPGKLDSYRILSCVAKRLLLRGPQKNSKARHEAAKKLKWRIG